MSGVTSSVKIEMDILSTTPPAVRARSERPVAAWQAELRDAIRDPRRVVPALGLPAELGRAGAGGRGGFRMPCAGELSRADRARQPGRSAVAAGAARGGRGASRCGLLADPVDEAAATLRRACCRSIAGRALLVVTGACPVHCRYCFRRHFPYDGPDRRRRGLGAGARRRCGRSDDPTK